MRSLFRDPNLYLVFATTLGGIAGVSLLVPALPEMQRHFGLTHAEVGLVLSMYTLPGLLFIVFIGMLADKFGRRALLIPLLLLFAFAGGGIFWAETFTQVAVLRFIQGIGGGALPSLAIILIGDLYEGKDRMKVMGLNAAVLSTGTASFPFIGGLMAETGWNLPFTAFWMGLPMAVAIALFLKEPPRREQENFFRYFAGAWKYISDAKTLLIFAMGMTVFILLYGGILTTLTLYMDERFAMPPYLIGIYVASASLASAIVSSQVQKIAQWLGYKTMLVIGFTLFALAFGSVPLVPGKEWLFLAFFLFGAAMGLVIPLLQNVVTSIPPPEYRGLLVSVFGLQIRVGQTFGPPLMALAAVNGLEGTFVACVLLSVAAIVLSLWKGRLLF